MKSIFSILQSLIVIAYMWKTSKIRKETSWKCFAQQTDSMLIIIGTEEIVKVSIWKCSKLTLQTQNLNCWRMQVMHMLAMSQVTYIMMEIWAMENATASAMKKVYDMTYTSNINVTVRKGNLEYVNSNILEVNCVEIWKFDCQFIFFLRSINLWRYKRFKRLKRELREECVRSLPGHELRHGSSNLHR